MSEPTRVQATLARLLAIDWASDMTRTDSRVVLLKEYLRRSAVWADRLGLPEDWPFYDLAAAVDPSVRADESLMEILADRVGSMGFYSPLWRAIQAMMHWAAIRDAGQVPDDVGPDLSDPFEPLLLMLERGGDFDTEHGQFVVDAVVLPAQRYENLLRRAPMESLDAEVLDAMDRSGPLHA